MASKDTTVVSGVRHAKGKPVDPVVRHTLARLVAATSDTDVANAAGVSRNTIARVLGGLPVYGSTAIAVTVYCERATLRPAA